MPKTVITIDEQGNFDVHMDRDEYPEFQILHIENPTSVWYSQEEIDPPPTGTFTERFGAIRHPHT